MTENKLVQIKSTSDILPVLFDFSIDKNYMKSLEAELDTFIETSEKTVVTEDTLSANKKYVADLNKKLQSLKILKKQAKDVVLGQLDTLNEQVDLLIDKITKADTLVREQNKHIDEQRKVRLQEEVEQEFNGYANSYDFKLFTFETFIRYNPIKLSTSVNKYKVAIIEFIERTSNEFEILQNLTDETSVYDEYKTLVETGRLNVALSTARQSDEEIKAVRKEIKEEIREEIRKEIKEEIKQNHFVITLTNEEDYKRVVNYMKKYKINFKESK